MLLPFVAMYLLRYVGYKLRTYDSLEEMTLKCSNLNGLNDLVLNKTTVLDIFDNYPKEDYVQGSKNIERNIFIFNPNINQHSYNEIRDTIGWLIINLDNILIDNKKNDVELHFYNDTLVEIKYRYPNDTYKGNYRKKLPKSFADTYGYGCPAESFFLDSISYQGSWHSLFGINRKYVNGDINMVLNSDFGDIIIFHKPKLLELISKIKYFTDNKSTNNKSINDKYIVRGSAEDQEYWRSIQREKELKDAGLYDAAKIERRARQDYVQGGGYTAPDGRGQIHFQGSKEQEEQLRMMDELGW